MRDWVGEGGRREGLCGYGRRRSEHIEGLTK